MGGKVKREIITKAQETDDESLGQQREDGTKKYFICEILDLSNQPIHDFIRGAAGIQNK